MRRYVVSGTVLAIAGVLIAYGIVLGNGIPIWLGTGLLACGAGVLGLSWLSSRGLD